MCRYRPGGRPQHQARPALAPGVGPALIPATAVHASGGTALNCHAMAGTMRPDTMTHRI
ncbi:hypothetical protein ARZXY2_2075 [Arthrobacter sp. ZXY-2]|nr:hypothetical protein ARZXY2_2075 [Arthrobacter sp. ZXY-2]